MKKQRYMTKGIQENLPSRIEGSFSGDEVPVKASTIKRMGSYLYKIKVEKKEESEKIWRIIIK